MKVNSFSLKELFSVGLIVSMEIFVIVIMLVLSVNVLRIIALLIISLMLCASASATIKRYKRSCMLTIWLVDFPDFLMMDKHPDMEIMYIDLSGVVLCSKSSRLQYYDWAGINQSNISYFDFERFYDKYKGFKQEIQVYNNPTPDGFTRCLMR